MMYVNCNKKRYNILISLVAMFAMIFMPIANADNERQTINDILKVCGPEKKAKPKKLHKRKKHRHHSIKVKRPVVIEKPQMCSDCSATIIYVQPQQFALKCFKKLLKGVAFATDPLPPCFKVYANDQGSAVLQPTPGFDERTMPVVNIFTRAPGCYVACYSNNPDKSVYALTRSIYMVGQIRVRGSYVGKMCVPENFETADIRGEKAFKELCSKSFSCAGNSCWAGPDTGAWFGLQ